MKTETYAAENAEEISPSWLKGHHKVGITGGASTTQQTIDEVVRRVRDLGG